MEKRDNYIIRRDEAKKQFLKFDQESLIRKFGLDHDERYIYMKFFNDDYRIDRENGEMDCSGDQFQTFREADFNEVLSVFDLLCHSEHCPRAGGNFAPVNSLKGRPGTIGVQPQTTGGFAEFFDQNPEGFRKACEALGGRKTTLGDIGYEFSVFRDLNVRLKFYRADEEFPASVVLLWDGNTLEYAFYETVFYMMNHLYGRITEKMKQQ